MNKQELLTAIARKSGDPVAAAARFTNALIEVITAELKAGREVSVVGFGKFHAVKRAARKGHNPRTGEAVKIAARRVPRFAAGKTLRDAVDRRRSK